MIGTDSSVHGPPARLKTRALWPSAETVCRPCSGEREGGGGRPALGEGRCSGRARLAGGSEPQRGAFPCPRVSPVTSCFLIEDMYTEILIQIRIDLGLKRLLWGQPGNLATYTVLILLKETVLVQNKHLASDTQKGFFW